VAKRGKNMAQTNGNGHAAPASLPARKYTPPQVAEAWGLAPETIIALIRNGSLRAVNAGLGKRKPRFLISEADIADFEERRAVRPVLRANRTTVQERVFFKR
jgi:hypothetical protein